MNKCRVTELLLLISELYGLLYCWNSLIDGVAGATVNEDLSMTKEENVLLNEFRARVFPSLPHAYMKHNLFLIRWLRARNLNVNEAEKMLRNNIAWRRKQKVDTILQEDWSDMEKDFPYTNSTFDKAGRPLLTINAANWDVRRIALAGKAPKLVRYFNKMMEETRMRVIEEQKKGKTVTRWTAIFNFDGFNPVPHVCPVCLTVYLGILDIVENRYPQEINRIYCTNTPILFNVMTDVLNPVMTPELRRSIMYTGPYTSQWKKDFDQEIRKDDITHEFGETLQA